MLRRVKGYSFQVRPSCKRQEQGSIEWAGAGARAEGAGAGASHKRERATSGTGTGRVSTPGDRLWVGARVSRYQGTPSRRTACLGV